MNGPWPLPETPDAMSLTMSAQLNRGKSLISTHFSPKSKTVVLGPYYDLVHTDLGDWHPREVNRGVTGAEASVVSPQEWLEGVLQEGRIPGRPDGQPDRATTSVSRSCSAPYT